MGRWYLGTGAVLLAVALLFAFPANAVIATVDLRTAATFAILSYGGIANTGITTVIGDVGSNPTQSGFGPGGNSVTITGTQHAADATTQTALRDAGSAYDDALTRTSSAMVGILGGQTLLPGVYDDDNAPDSMQITGTLTLNGTDDPNAVFLFRSGSTLIMAAAANVVLTHGAQACHVFWQVTSSATLGANAHLEGTILAWMSITLGARATVGGGLVARNGLVTLDADTVDRAPCAAPATSTSSASPTTATTASTTATTAATTVTTVSTTTKTLAAAAVATTTITATAPESTTTTPPTSGSAALARAATTSSTRGLMDLGHHDLPPAAPSSQPFLPTTAAMVITGGVILGVLFAGMPRLRV